jgi:YjbR
VVARIEPAEVVVLRLRTVAMSLPEAREEDAWTGVRWRIRTTTFAHVMVAQPGFESAYREITGDDSTRTVLTFRATGDELLALTHAGLPFYKPPWSPTIVGMVLDDDTDWAEVAELVTESYRCCAPQKLVRILDAPGPAAGTDGGRGPAGRPGGTLH